MARVKSTVRPHPPPGLPRARFPPPAWKGQNSFGATPTEAAGPNVDSNVGSNVGTNMGSNGVTNPGTDLRLSTMVVRVPRHHRIPVTEDDAYRPISRRTAPHRPLRLDDDGVVRRRPAPRQPPRQELK
ncbi:hypothetical protein SNE40_004021 [Patella caerulea]|uniref:Uncharacterized protein n=1 Tax=Patella caerulea TaxID=87958 RepID=A0AAN8Q655_PATCE